MLELVDIFYYYHIVYSWNNVHLHNKLAKTALKYLWDRKERLAKNNRGSARYQKLKCRKNLEEHKCRRFRKYADEQIISHRERKELEISDHKCFNHQAIYAGCNVTNAFYSFIKVATRVRVRLQKNCYHYTL